MFLRANQIPILIVTFCLLWSSAFAAPKAALIDCPPLLLVTARCLLAGGFDLGHRRRSARGLAGFAAGFRRAHPARVGKQRALSRAEQPRDAVRRGRRRRSDREC